MQNIISVVGERGWKIKVQGKREGEEEKEENGI